MIRLFFVVEGQTEEAFVKGVLASHFADRNIDARATIVGTPKRRGSSPLQKGGGDWPRWERDVRRILGQQRGREVRVTTLFDLYGLPEGFPGLEEHGGVADTRIRCELLEQSLAQRFDDWRFVPYVQRHEFEALVLASLASLRELLDAQDALEGWQALHAEVSGLAPEDVNDGRTTAPSKRLRARIPGYSKTTHGPLATEATGLASLRERCQRFDAWITRLEASALGGG